MALKISIIIPVFNAEDFIQKSYDNIQNQGIDNFEIIYINNNSTDTSVEQIEKLQQKDQTVHLYHEEKQGAAAARNLGIRKAKGEYLYVFDVDDEIYPLALRRMIEVLDTNSDVDAVFGKMIKSRKGIQETIKPDDESHKVKIQPAPYWGLNWFADLSTVVGPPAFLYKATVFDIIGLYNEDLIIGEDTALDIKLGMLCQVAFLDTYVYLYYKHHESTMEKSKIDSLNIFTSWPRLVKEHIPFYLKHHPGSKFEYLLLKQLYSSLAKQIILTKSYSKRKIVKNELMGEVLPLKIPKIIKSFLSILCAVPSNKLLKLYLYKIIPYSLRFFRD